MSMCKKKSFIQGMNKDSNIKTLYTTYKTMIDEN